MVDVGKGLTLVIGGFVVFLIFSLFVPLYLGFYNSVDASQFTTSGQTAWAAIPDFMAIGGMLLGVGIFILGVLEMVGISVTKRMGLSS